MNVYRCQIGCHNKKGSGLLLILGAITKLEKQNHDPAIAVVILKRGAAEQARDDCLMRSVKKSSRTSTVRDDVCHVNTMDQRETVQDYSGGFGRLRAASVLVSPGRQNQWRFTPLPCVRTEASGGRTDGFVPMCGAQKIPDIG